MVFIASFAIHKDNDYRIKDVTVTCHHAAPSGSDIDKNARTVFEKVSSRGYTYVRDINMGFVAAQAVKTACIATGFSRHNDPIGSRLTCGAVERSVGGHLSRQRRSCRKGAAGLQVPDLPFWRCHAEPQADPTRVV